MMRCASAGLLIFSLFLVGFAAHAKDPKLDRFEKSIAKFEKTDVDKPFAPGGVVFTGSSSIASWANLDKYFPGIPVLNRGFGGSTIPEVNHYLDRVVLKHKPAAVVLFCGGNDIAGKRSPEQVFADFQTFYKKIHETLPETKIFYLSIHTPPGRVAQAESIQAVNNAIQEECRKNPKLSFVNISPLMKTADGKPDPDLYRDPLHPTPKAYEKWAEVLRPLLQPYAKK